jgi:hypothetical protein
MTAAVLAATLLLPAQPPAPEAQARAAREKAIKYLKEKQKDGSWDEATHIIAGMKGGMTALVTLALLEAGVPADDPAVKAAVEYLLTVEPDKTYVVSLQTQVLARVDLKKHAARIQKNADWLVAKAVRNGGRLEGWTYPATQAATTVADGSNSHFAVVGLHVAAEAGANVDEKVWIEIRELYVRTRTDRGWVYHHATPSSAATATMTGAGLLCLTLSGQHLLKDATATAAFEKEMAAFLDRPRDGKSDGYLWLVTARLGRALGTDTFKAGDRAVAWHREGVEKLVKTQKPDGSWASGTGLDNQPVYQTACGLYFLGHPAMK